MKMKSLEFLYKKFEKNELFDNEDLPIMKTIKNTLAISDMEVTQDINSQLKSQVELEANMIYLLGKYREIFDSHKYNFDLYAAQEFERIPDETYAGNKVTFSDKAVKLLGSDEFYAKLQKKVIDYESIVRYLDLLGKTIFTRDRKLEQLSNNYRQEYKQSAKVY